MLYNVVLIPAVQQCKSAIIIHTRPPSLASLPSPIPSFQVITDCQTRFPVLHSNFSPVTYFKHGSVYRCYFLHSSHSLLPLVCPQLHSLYLSLHSFPANRFINTIFSRFHIYALIYDICFSLSDLFHSVQDSRSIHFIGTDSNVFFLWLSNIPLYICTISPLPIHLSMYI